MMITFESVLKILGHLLGSFTVVLLLGYLEHKTLGKYSNVCYRKVMSPVWKLTAKKEGEENVHAKATHSHKHAES